ncbi:LptF/LptG family permease [Saprospira sp. CCB-QB6]|uniref:LptF/LptG family permease n=1 Tax=Saprospira sp. CCB-QB6 TaxID=3023936 RepID=UPI002348F63D|nr:LptF/LptG family permease [Saprospira sp. CCB-QB6]WCL80126.1 LptF/LptG family permease [Saprospira sp. CCB-QB6]
MKKLDKLLVISFLPPLIIWFLVAVFIFNMQFLWKYVDDIVGKGLEVHIILELLFYQALAMVPQALVFGVVIASVMTLGNLSEHYELASMKSAGISLIRILRPLFFFVLLLGGASYFFSNVIIPVTALQFKTRLYDIRKQRPALDLQVGQFNNDFRNMTIYIGGKEGNQLENMRIYDHSEQRGNSSQTNANFGQLSLSKDKRYLLLELEDGKRFEEMQQGLDKKTSFYPFMRMNFKTYRSVFDLSEFDFSETDKDLFKNHYSLLNSKQLLNGIDSILNKRARRIQELQRNSDNFFYFRKMGGLKVDSLPNRPDKQYIPFANLAQVKPLAGAKNWKSIVEQNKKLDRHAVYQRAQSFARNIKSQAQNVNRGLPHYEEDVAEHENELHKKIIFALACVLFLFVGAPMGAIIKKGGFGWPIFVAFVFFMTFFVLHLTGERLAKKLVWPCWAGSWLPILVLLPLAILLSRAALRDAQLISFSAIWSKIKSILPKKKTA